MWQRRNSGSFHPGDRWCPRWNQVVSSLNPNHVWIKPTLTIQWQSTTLALDLFSCFGARLCRFFRSNQENPPQLDRLLKNNVTAGIKRTRMVTTAKLKVSKCLSTKWHTQRHSRMKLRLLPLQRKQCEVWLIVSSDVTGVCVSWAEDSKSENETNLSAYQLAPRLCFRLQVSRLH